MKYVAILLCSILTACATTAAYEKILSSWVGSSENDLVRSWGPPDSVYENSGTKYLTYSKSEHGYVPGVAPTYRTNVVGNTAYTRAVGGSPGYAISQQCKTSFELVGGQVVSWRHEGNGCTAIEK
jgi:hypothetical protein